MLNELFEANASILSAGITAQTWHKDYGTCPKNKTFQVLVSEDGTVAGLNPVSDLEKIKSLRKWEISNGTSFPAFNVMPLFHVATEDAMNELTALRKLLKQPNGIGREIVSDAVVRIRKASRLLWNQSETERIERCLKAHPRNLASILGKVPPDFESIDSLVRRAALMSVDLLMARIETCVVDHISRSPGDAGLGINSLLVSTTADARRVKKVSLVLEVADSSKYKYPANHNCLQEWINSRLMASGTGLVSHTVSKLDAFGLPFDDAASGKKFPEAELQQVLGKVTLRAMSSESPCQARYGKADAMSFACGTRTRQLMKDSLEWLGDTQRKGKTWQDVSDACGYDRGILFAYPSNLPADPPELAGQFAGDEEGAKFEAAAARVTTALQGLIKIHPDTEIRVFVLAKPDGYRTKVLVTQNYVAMHMIIAAQAWQDGCANIPLINLNIGEQKNPVLITPLVPFPAEMVKCLNVAWLRSGTRTTTTHRLGIGEGIGLLMETGRRSQAIASHALELAVRNASPLLLALSHASHRRDASFKWSKDKDANTAKYAKHANLLPSSLGLLLDKLNHKKGEYMHNPPFLVGQMLALADTLHMEYCIHVRKKETPPQLIGSALMPTALDNPTAGLARLSERIVPYQAWATTATGEGVGLAKWALLQFRRVAGELKSQTLPERCRDTDKAQLLLGYLAQVEGNTCN